MKKKFIKVSLSERFPTKQGMYMVIFKNNKVGKFNFWTEEAFKESWIEHIEFWFEEVPDLEEKMKEILREIYPLLMERHLYESGQKIAKILNESYLTN